MAERHGCLRVNGTSLVAYAVHREARVSYTVSFVVRPRGRKYNDHVFMLNIQPGRALSPMWFSQGKSPGEYVVPERLTKTSFSALVTTCMSTSAADRFHAAADFTFPTRAYRTFMELPMESPDQALSIRGLRVADAEDCNYVVLDVPGPENDELNVTCSLRIDDGAVVDGAVLASAMDRLSSHISDMVVPREG